MSQLGVTKLAQCSVQHRATVGLFAQLATSQKRVQTGVGIASLNVRALKSERNDAACVRPSAMRSRSLKMKSGQIVHDATQSKFGVKFGKSTFATNSVFCNFCGIHFFVVCI
jgi:hypothetical protein